MSKSNAKNKEEINVEEESKNRQVSSNEIIIADSALRSLYHLGYNSKSLTKTVANSFKFDEVINVIKEYVERDELSIKATAPLLLGLVRVYDKQIKLYLEELATLFQVKKSETTNEANENKVAKSKKKLGKDALLDSTAIDTGSNPQHSSFFNNNILSLSPLNEGLFSMLNRDGKMTPSSKFMYSGKSDQISPQSIELFRNQQNSALTDTKSKMNLIASNMKASNNAIHEKSLLEEEHQDVKNFFQFISDNVHPEIDPDFEIPHNLNYGLNLNGTEAKTADIAKQLIFNSDSKTLFNLGALNNETNINLNISLKAKAKNITKNFKYQYDEQIEIDLDEVNNLNDKESSRDLLDRFKNKLRLTQEQNLDDILDLNNQKKVNMMSFNRKNILLNDKNATSLQDLTVNEPDEYFINNFNNLDVKDFGLNEGELSLRDRLNKLMEEEKEEKREDEKNNFEDNFDDQGKNEDFAGMNNAPYDNNIGQSDDNQERNLEKFSAILQSVVKGKKKTSFIALNNKIKDEIPPHQTFYNLLCLAQREALSISQDKVFNNESISFSIL